VTVPNAPLDSGNVREYIVPGKWGTGEEDDYSRVIIIITDLTNTEVTGFKKTYDIMASTEEWEE
jgi:hypothetical protein